ncbi:hypothetical protein [Microbacterium deminutum]|uniref:Exo-alpha-sialidase n=1 Tax=Microbacterium deminutum TaxID=344164 RepID=A0ABP5D009_9MICO
MISVVNVVPQSLSGETNQDSEPSITVNPANPNEIVISAFTPNPFSATGNAPVFVSTDGGTTWSLNTVILSQSSTRDITASFGGGGRLYSGILRNPGSFRLNIARGTSSALATAIVDRTNVDQPFTKVGIVPSGPGAGNDRAYVGINDLALASTTGRTATVEVSLDAGAAAPAFASQRIERRGTGTAGQNGPQVRPAVHSDGTVYAAFCGWRSFSAASLVTTDIVLVRDDNWAGSGTTFDDLLDPADNVAGNRVVQGVTFTWNGTLGNDRLGGDLAIGVDPRDSGTVYLAWADVQSGSYTLHLRRSTDRGVTFSADLRTISNAKNPAIAINDDGLVGFAYQQVTGAAAAQRWETHLETSSNAFFTSDDLVLSTTPANTPAPTFLPYLGDYIHMVAHGTSFYGVFSANNTPDNANFPQGVTYQRNHDFGTHQLFAVNGTTLVNPSVDPFFFKFTPLPHLTRFTVFTGFTRFTDFTRFTRFTPFTLFTGLTRFTEFTRFTPFTEFTRFTRFVPLTRFTGFTRPPGPGPGPAPFIRFGNAVFTPDTLHVKNFEALAGVADELASVGITGLHQLATADPVLLAGQIGWSREDATEAVRTAQQLLLGL